MLEPVSSGLGRNGPWLQNQWLRVETRQDDGTISPVGLDGVDRYPALLEELLRRGWTDADIAKLAGENVLRVMAAAEKVALKLRAERPASGVLFGESNAR